MSAIELLKNARRAFDVGNTDRALSFYEQALEIDPGGWEAFYFTTVLRLLDIRKGEIRDAIKIVAQQTTNLHNLWLNIDITSSVSNPEEIQEHLYRIASFVDHFGQNLAAPNIDIITEFELRHLTFHIMYVAYKNLALLAQVYAKGKPVHKHILDLTVAFLSDNVLELYNVDQEGFANLNNDVSELITHIHNAFPGTDVSVLQGLEEQLQKKKNSGVRETLRLVLLCLSPFIGMGLIALLVVLFM